MFSSYFNESILARAQKNKIIEIKTHNLRKWATDKHKTVDDAPYGGGAGMVMKVEPIYRALQAIKKQNKEAKRQKIILLSAKGKKWNQQMAKKYSKMDSIILICGRYEGVDERVKKFIDEEISIGDYVLTGGEIPAMVVVDSVTRLLPGVLGNAESARQESHSEPGVLEHPQYTRPEIFTVPANIKRKKTKTPLSGSRSRSDAGAKMVEKVKNYRVPKVLLSGDHKKIKEWKEKHSKKLIV